MKNKFIQLALVAVIAAASAAPALAQNTNWKLNSDHSTGRLSLGSTADPQATFDVGIANVRGIVTLDANSLANSTFNFTIYPADQDPATINTDGSVIVAEFSDVARSTVINFQSRKLTPIADGSLAVTGDLTLTHLERPVVIVYSEAYAGPVYGEPVVHSSTHEVTFVIDKAAAAAAESASARQLKLIATTGIKTEDFPGLFEAVTNTDWPLVVEDKSCQFPPSIEEDYSGSSCTGTPLVVVSNSPVPQTIGEDYPGPDTVTPQVHDSVNIALNLELTPDTSTSAAASGN